MAGHWHTLERLRECDCWPSAAIDELEDNIVAQHNPAYRGGHANCEGCAIRRRRVGECDCWLTFMRDPFAAGLGLHWLSDHPQNLHHFYRARRRAAEDAASDAALAAMYARWNAWNAAHPEVWGNERIPIWRVPVRPVPGAPR